LRFELEKDFIVATPKDIRQDGTHAVIDRILQPALITLNSAGDTKKARPEPSLLGQGGFWSRLQARKDIAISSSLRYFYRSHGGYSLAQRG
jgi:hypothetical protein